MTTNKYKILFIVSLCSFLTPFIGSSINLALPLIGKEFDMNIVSLGWVATIFLLSTAVFLVPMGRLADIFGRKKIFMGGVIIFALTSLLCSFATSGTFLIIARALQGIGSAMFMGVAMAILVSVFPAQERGKALGLNVTGVYLGASLGPVLGGMITQSLGWRYIFVFAALLGLIVVIMGFTYLKAVHDLAHAKGESFDFKGSVLYAFAVIALLYGSTMLPALAGYGLMAAGIITLIIFCLVENHIKHPVFDMHLLLKNRTFALANVAALLSFSASFAIPFIMSMYLQYIQVLSPRQTGLMLLISAVTLIFGSPLAGRLADRRDARIIASIGMALSATSLITLGLILTTNTSLVVIGACMVLYGIGSSLFGTPNTHAAMESVLPRHVGLASSLLSTMRVFGQTVSMGTTMLILSLIIGKVSISPTVLPELLLSTRIIFCIFSLFCIGGMFASLVRGKKQPEELV